VDLKVGMSASVDVVVDESKNVVLVPSRAISVTASRPSSRS